MSHIHFSVPALAGLLLLAGCATSYYAPPSDPVLIATPESPDEVRAAVVRALSARRFETEQEQPGQIVARHDKGKYSLRIAVTYDGAHYRVRYVDSDGYDTQPGPGGSTTIETRGVKEIRGLVASIERELQRPAKEAADREKREREYQLKIEQEQTSRAQADARAAEANAQAAQGTDPSGPSPVQVVMPVNLPTPSLGGGGGLNLSSHSSTVQGSQSITCCINGALYDCPSQDAFNQCMSTNPSACTRNTSRSCQ